MSVQQRVEQLVNNKQYLLIDSALRSSGIAEDFLFNLPNLVTGVSTITPIYCIITNSVYNITAVTNVFGIIRSGVNIDLGIPVGSYTINQLITALDILWNPLNIDFQYDPNTLKIVITETNGIPFKINQQTATMSTVLGFTTAFPFESEAIIQESNSVTRLDNQYDYIHINIDTVQQFYGDQLRNYLVSLPLQSVPFGKTQLVQFPPNLSVIASKSFFQTIAVKLTDKNFNVISNNNSDYLILLELRFL